MPFRDRYTGLINKYRDRLPVHDDTRIISLGEGNTPLIRLQNIPRELGKEVDIYVKYEGLNPTGSFKDRGMTAAISEAAGRGAQAVICASTGNTAASAAGMRGVRNEPVAIIFQDSYAKPRPAIMITAPTRVAPIVSARPWPYG